MNKPPYPTSETEPEVDQEPERPATEANEQEPKAVEEEPNPETVLESVQDVRELMDAWAEEYHRDDTLAERKGELAYELAQMALALAAARLRPERVKVREVEPGVYGLYDPSHKQPSITFEGLELPAHRFKDILVHEAVHKGVFTGGREIRDEGLTQLATEERVPGHLHGIYESEKRRVVKAFGSEPGDLHDVLDEYNFKDPDFLAREHLKRFWDDAWEERFQAAIAKRARPHKRSDQLLKDVLEEPLRTTEERFKKAAPNLYDKLKAQGFNFREEQLKVLRDLYEQDIAA